MFFKKPKWKRFISSLLMLAILAALFPISALALTVTDSETDISLRAEHFYVDSDGNYTQKLGDKEAEAELGEVEDKLTESFEKGATFTDNTVSAYVYSSDMLVSERDGSVIPYVLDASGRKWELYKVEVANGRTIDNPGDHELLMSFDAIKNAASLDDYVVNTEDIAMTPGSRNYYFIWYSWKLAEDEPEEVTSYHISYDLNLPSDTDSVFPVISYPETTSLDAGGDWGGDKSNILTTLNELEATVYAGQTYVISDFDSTSYGTNRNYIDFLAFNMQEDFNGSGTESFYAFDGWAVGADHTKFTIGQEITTDDIIALADGNNDIEFKAQWKKITLLSQDELKAKAAKLPLDVFTANGNNLILQSVTATNGKTSEDVSLQKGDTISYYVSARVDSDRTAVSDAGGMQYQDGFAEFTFHVDVDSRLEFANVDADGKVTITFSASPDSTAYYAPVVFEETNIPDAVANKSSEGVYSLTFDPAGVPNDPTSGNMNIEITVKWATGTVSKINRYADLEVYDLDFKLKDDVDSSAKILTTANITGAMTTKKIASPPRAYYGRAAYIINSEPEWKAQLGGVTAEAYVYTLQLMNYKLSNIDLAADQNARLQANTVKADILYGTVKITPANMTIYMGGDDGYDAVVDGTTTGNDDKPSNSMPTPLFYVDVSGVTVEDVEDDITLTGAQGREWKFRLAGKDSHGENLYYIDSTGSDEQDPVRVAFEGKDGKYHLNDTFDPAAVDELFTTYEISIYSGSAGTVLAQVDGKVHNVAVGTGTLTVRAVEETEDNPVVPVTETVTAPVSAGSAAVTAPSGTTYTLNDTTVSVTGDGVGLLFDGIIDDATHNRTDALVEAIETDYRINIRDGYFQAQYLDLVDADNGNAWIKANKDVTVYWGYPEGTNQNTKFTLYHFTDLHRDNSQGSDSGFDINDIAKSAIEVVDIEKTANGIAFDVEPGGFSPFVLVWEKPSWPIIIPDIPEDTTPNWLNLDDHDAYLQGYPDGRVKPENNITRAEVATIFFRLLTDDAREYYYSTDSGFSDVKPGDWYNNAVSTMVNAGVITGYNDGTFRPNDPITRAEFATIAARFLSDPYSLQDQFYDTEGHWAEVYINRAAEVGWINGYNDGSFRPNKAITRAEAVTLVNNVLGREPHADYMLDDMITWPDNPKSAWYYEDIQEATNSHDYRWSSGKRYEIWTSLN